MATPPEHEGFAEAFRRVSAAINGSHTLSERAKAIALKTLEQVRAELEGADKSDAPKPLPDLPEGWKREG